MFKKLSLILLLIIFLLTGCNVNDDSNINNNDDNDDPEDIMTDVAPSICYIPLDDRPVNTTRCEYLAASAGFDLIMPDADLYKTHLDNQLLNSNNTQYGDPIKLIEWLEGIDATYYVISLDQILSGGLVNSRVVKEIDAFNAFNIIERILEHTKGKQTIIFDTVMRLASTVGYNGYVMNEYTALRNYGSVARVELTGEFSVDDIISGYKYSSTNQVITSSLSQTVIDDYLSARTRKIKISEYLLNALKNNDNTYLYYGVDDSSPSKTIQTNEINYIKNHLSSGTLFAGTDELGLMSITKVIKEHYQTSINAKVSYFGGQEDSAADAYDISTLKLNLNTHLESLDINVVNDDFDLEVLVLTKPTNKSQTTKNVTQLVSALQYNLNHQIPTIVIDGSNTSNYGYLEEVLVKQVSLGKLLGYSNWNTVGNAIGIALSNGISRYCYLSSPINYSNEIKAKANEGFLKTITFAYIKDIGYKISGQSSVITYIRENIGDTSNFYNESLDLESISSNVSRLLFDDTKGSLVTAILENLNESVYITNYKDYHEEEINNISISDFYFPWYRTFEIDFKIVLGS